jgi:hypothetical protein
MIESREETCDECGWTCDREWRVRTLSKGTPVPRGYRVEKRAGDWKTVAAPTRMTTLCGCDVP